MNSFLKEISAEQIAAAAADLAAGATSMASGATGLAVGAHQDRARLREAYYADALKLLNRRSCREKLDAIPLGQDADRDIHTVRFTIRARTFAAANARGDSSNFNIVMHVNLCTGNTELAWSNHREPNGSKTWRTEIMSHTCRRFSDASWLGPGPSTNT